VKKYFTKIYDNGAFNPRKGNGKNNHPNPGSKDAFKFFSVLGIKIVVIHGNGIVR
jgi:hypothetical protein